ncbi:hypothetical protein ACFOY2_03760 [Nonomuraea purpurea]|uniref:Uncharacterized protein n=1 Tax=Nonomuraea purpurea TaxID=1849276 RepID=A0ABV8G1B0_9ACTN
MTEMTDTTSLLIIGLIAFAVMGVLLLAGIVMTAMGRRNHGSAATIGMVGCIVLLLGLVFNTLRGLALPMLSDTFGMSLNMLFTVGNVLSLLFEVIGTGLLIWAVVARRNPPTPAGPQGPAWQQPASEWQQQPGRQSPQPGHQPGHQPGQQPGWQTPPQPPYGEGPR